MKKGFLLLLFFAINMLCATTIHDIQYSTNAGQYDSYPSPLEGDNVTLTGIVSGTNCNGANYFISESEGGAWNGIFIYDNNNSLEVGQEVTLSGEVEEYWGMTEIMDVTSTNVISSNNEIASTDVTTNQAANNEEYEGVLVSIDNIEVVSGYDDYGYITINDGSGNLKVGSKMYSLQSNSVDIQDGMSITNLTGIITYSYGQYVINPRTENDIIFGDMPISISSPVVNGDLNDTITIPFQIRCANEIDLNSFSMEFSYNNVMFNIEEVTSTTLEGMTSNWTNNRVNVTYNGNESVNNNDILFTLKLNAISSGNTSIYVYNCSINDEEIENVSLGDITIDTNYDIDADKLTVIQRPILTIPEITHIGEDFEIWASAPESVSDWTVKLLHKNDEFLLNVISDEYDSEREWHVITVNVPSIDYFELFDLELSALGIENDIAKHAVKVEATPNDDWYFIHVTDAHMPTHQFSHDSGYYNDMTEVDDFLSVLEDIKYINPKFVLFTGDVVNEGELEEYLDAHYFSIAKNVMSQCEVPLYLTSGNHDLGGWDSTPMPDGTSRESWWEFFGWDILANPNGLYPYRTQNYTFKYNDIKFIGLEAYVNYEHFQTSIYGNESFTNNQMNWLNQEVSTSEETKILFYHYDFQEEINLNSLGVDMALWGHIHSDQGSLTSQPYNIATAATCDGRRKYRVIKVSGNQLTPLASVSAGSAGNSFTVTYSYDIVADNVAHITNNHPISFDNVLVKFKLPEGSSNIEVTNGSLTQIVPEDNNLVAYVTCEIGANETKDVTVSSVTEIDNNDVIEQNINFVTVYPNPNRNDKFYIKYNMNKADNTSISVYNLKGQLVDKIVEHKMSEKGENNLSWSPTKQLANGIYFIKIKSSQKSKITKFIKMK